MKKLINRKLELGKSQDEELSSFKNDLFKNDPRIAEKVIKRLTELATDKSVEDVVNLKAIELILAYTYGKPTDSKPETGPQRLVIEHNTITVDEVKKQKQ